MPASSEIEGPNMSPSATLTLTGILTAPKVHARADEGMRMDLRRVYLYLFARTTISDERGTLDSDARITDSP